VCGAVPHPSIQLEQAHGGKPVELLSRVTRPVLLLPAQVECWEVDGDG